MKHNIQYCILLTLVTLTAWPAPRLPVPSEGVAFLHARPRFATIAWIKKRAIGCVQTMKNVQKQILVVLCTQRVVKDHQFVL